jgi:thioredoxin-like negative regulator of GroEL
MDSYNKLINSKKIVIIYFYSDECLKISNILDKLDNELNGKNVLISRYNVEESNTKILIETFDIKCYPFFYIYKNGVLIDQILGIFVNIETILNLYINI